MLLLFAALYHALQTLYTLFIKDANAKEIKDVEAQIPVRGEDPIQLKANIARMKRYFKRIVVISDDVKEYTDNLRKVLRGLAEVIQGPIAGKGAALQKGLEVATEDWIMILDADNYVLEPPRGSCEVNAPLWVGRSVGSRWSEACSTVTTAAAKALILGRGALGLYLMAPGGGILVKRDVAKELGWRNVMTEDLDFSIRAWKKGYKVCPGTKVSVECPAGYLELREQQARWVYGSTRVIVENLDFLLSSPKGIELLFYLSQHVTSFIPLLALLLSPLLGSPLFVLIYYIVVGVQGYQYKKLGVPTRDLARMGAAGSAMALRNLQAFLWALMGKRWRWVVTPKGGKRLKAPLTWEYTLLIISSLSLPFVPFYYWPIAFQYILSSYFVIKEP